MGVLNNSMVCQVTSGYYENPEATADAVDAEGWFHTGDVVTYDEDGYFYIVDRIKDMIKVQEGRTVRVLCH